MRFKTSFAGFSEDTEKVPGTQAFLLLDCVVVFCMAVGVWGPTRNS